MAEIATVWHGPQHVGACYNAACDICHRRVRGIMYYAAQSHWRVGTRSGVSFWYRHVGCHREEVRNAQTVSA